MKVWGVVGWKNSGKTTVVERLVSEFVARGLMVSTLKHSHHAFEIDRPGTDSARHVSAGASEVMLGTCSRWALMHEHGTPVDEPDAELATLLSRMSPTDLVLVEGFKGADIPKLEVIGPGAPAETVASKFPGVRAFAFDGKSPTSLPCFPRDDTRSQADFILAELGLSL